MNKLQFLSLFRDALIKHKISYWDPCTSTCIAGDCSMGGGGCCPTVTTTPLLIDPAPAGNALVNQFVTGPTGTIFYIDDQGRALALNSTAPTNTHSHTTSTGAYSSGSPLAGWVAPSGAIAGDTIVVKYTDYELGFFTYDGASWVLDFTTKEPILTFASLPLANAALGLGRVFRYTDNNVGGLFGLDVTH